MAYVRLRDVSVEFPVYNVGSRSLKKLLLNTTALGNIAKDAHDRITVQALSGISLDLDHGDRLALIGVNGAGKSALLTASVGLNPDATGRENIVMRGMFMDVHPREMRARVEEVAAFTELGHYLDMPVRTYSAGMLIRLCFAVATAIPPEILLMDEWLAAGDELFLAKARGRMEHLITGSSIMVLASHSLPLLKEWCNRAIMLEGGRVVAAGSVEEVAALYQRGGQG